MHSLSITIADKPVTVTADGRTPDNRPRYSYTVGTHTANDLAGPVGGPHVLSAGMASLLGFMYACAESVDYTQRTGREGDNLDLFPESMHDWLSAYDMEIQSALMEYEEA
jgi:hypothetical protein